MSYAAIYARKSTDQTRVVDGERSVTRQVDHARAYAESKGWTIAEEHVYVDDGISGAEFSNRPGFLRLMNALKPRPAFDILVMSEESRLGREQIETSYALKQLVQAGVRIFFYLEDRERTLDSPTDKVLLSLTAFADELEREKARQRTKDAMVRKAKAGHVTGGRCFGYTNVEVLGPNGERSHVERKVKDQEAEVVREIFRLCAKGYGKTRIAKTLNEQGAASPRAQQGRPRAWAPSSVRSVLYREMYRGQIVWNKSKKRDAWGRQHQQARPEAEWMRVEAPEIRIVSNELWKAAHDRLDSARKNYLRSHNGQLWGRPPSGVESKYLLVGQARCGLCGGSIEARSRSHRSRRAYFYACSSYWRRGKAVCENRHEIPMKVADAIVLNTLLDEILTPERLVEVTQRTLARAQALRQSPDRAREPLKQQLAHAEAALARLTEAVARGGDVPALVEAIKTQEERRQALESRLAAMVEPPVVFDGLLEKRLRAAVGEWREVLGRQVPQARQIVSKLIANRITFTPEVRDGEPGFRFQATGTVEKLVSGLVPGFSQAVASPTGFEPESPA